MQAQAKRSTLRLLPVAVFVAIAGLFLFALRAGDPSKLPSTLLGKPAPSTSFPPVDGLLADGKPMAGFSSADLSKGRVSIVNFWASWCASCVEEHPRLADLKVASGVNVYGVAQKDEPSASRRFLSRYGNPFTAVGTDQNGRASIEWGVYGMPETFIVNGKGEIVYKHIGPISAESIQSKILPAIAVAKGEKPKS